MSFKTPGVYIKEISLFPPSVAEVETAIPAFIGYTEKAERNGENLYPDLVNNVFPKPIKIGSLLDYQRFFGGPPSPRSLVVDLDSGNNPLKVSIENAYYLYDSLRMFFDNGGGDCYIVAVGSYADTITADDLKAGIDALKKEDEPTLLLFPDAVSPGALTDAELGGVQQKALLQCNTLQDRFCIFDVRNAGPDADIDDEAKVFRDNIGINYLKYGAGYYPNIRTTITIDPGFEDITLKKGGNAIDLSAISQDTAIIDDLKSALRSLRGDAGNNLDGLEKLLKALHGTSNNQTYLDWYESVATPDKTQIVHWATVIKTIAVDMLQLSSGGTFQASNAGVLGLIDTELNASSQMRNIIQKLTDYDYGYKFIPNLATALPLTSINTVTHIFQVGGDITADLNPDDKITIQGGASNDGTYTVVSAVLNGTDTDIEVAEAIPSSTIAGNLLYSPSGVTRLGVIADSGGVITDFDGANVPFHPFTGAPDYQLVRSSANFTIYGTGTTESEFAKASAAAFRTLFETTLGILNSLIGQTQIMLDNLESNLIGSNPVYANIVRAIRRENIVLPPSGAIAGIYAAVDEDRGVWKAPANVSVASVVGPVVKIDDRDQEGLNIDTTAGKSINAIRAFTGKGTLVWGARTLAGNDNEWRYIPVRRFFNMVEESVKKATAFAVFEPNDARTWSKVRALISNYLVEKWKEGALQGATPEEAFFVKVGLGLTMTAEDILNGFMKVEIGMAVVRPAEFIILSFSHKLVGTP